MVPAAPKRGPVDRRVRRQARRVGTDRKAVGGGTLFTEPVLVVNQRGRIFGSLLTYEIYDQHGRQLGTVREERRGPLRTLGDGIRLKDEAERKRELVIRDMDGRPVLQITRPERRSMGKHDMVVAGAGGEEIGRISQESHGLLGASVNVVTMLGIVGASVVGSVIPGVRGMAARAAVKGASPIAARAAFANPLGHAWFGLEAGGQRLGTLHALDAAKWDFRIADARGKEIGSVTKTWAGWVKERFTKADHYVVQMQGHLEHPLRSLVLAASIALDIAFQEREPSRHPHRYERRRRGTIQDD